MKPCFVIFLCWKYGCSREPPYFFVFIRYLCGIKSFLTMDKAMFSAIVEKSFGGERLSKEEALALWYDAPLDLLMEAADRLRQQKVADPEVVTWQIDRNVNITNVCISGCKFCNFHCRLSERDKSYITSLDEYYTKIDETRALGGDQLLLQGGLHPHLDIDYYEELFRALKERYPWLRLNALGAPEVSHIARISGITTAEALRRLREAGLDTLPGAGAEILSPRVRKAISPAKPSVEEWAAVMREAHRQGIPSTATMMYGHIETIEERIDHLLLLRDIQADKPDTSRGFTAFIPWIFCSTGTRLEEEGVVSHFDADEYLRLVAVSRLVLNNIDNLQASWLTVGKEVAQRALRGGANDMGSIMIEENVVSSAGANNRFNAEGIRAAIREAGFTPRLRDQLYNYRDDSFLA